MERTLIQVIATMMVFLTLGFQPVLSQVEITRTGCGTTKFCLEEPVKCDPAVNTTPCLFGSGKATAFNNLTGIDLTFELSGNSTGYIALGLSQNASVGSTMLFVCGQNSSSNRTFFFMTMTLDNVNANLTSLARNVTGLQSSVVGENIKCKFSVSNLNATATALQTRANKDTTFQVVIGSGPFDGNTLGRFNLARNSGSLDLSVFLPNSTTNTTAAPSGANRPLYSNAVLPLLSFLTLSILKFA
ncbi:putative ferric-chelate reductase 1 [Girardinichthys multiradiatus]|uniref:putative ferric-chelate reductase 1 n=1 Tax=Girardinichthys multiradiatus TaxID=208333 RepID=UPI001FADDA59|nr:putative ferric-chelate reductase 1 [Girardinichthys multiradiatus]